MAASRRYDLADPEFESIPPVPVRLRDYNPLDHQRLVVNPFLAVLGLIAWAWALVRILELHSSSQGAFVIFLFLAGLPHLVQFHCLDCGKTGRYIRRDQHSCPTVVARWNSGESSHFPSSRGQFLVWCWILGSLGILLLVMSLSGK